MINQMGLYNVYIVAASYLVYRTIISGYVFAEVGWRFASSLGHDLTWPGSWYSIKGTRTIRPTLHRI